MFSHVSVCSQGVVAYLPTMPWGRQILPPPPPPCHTVNRRAEGILLECMLVNFSLSCQFCNFDYFILTNVGNHYLSLIFFQLRLWKFSCHGGLRRWLQTRYDGLFKFLNLISIHSSSLSQRPVLSRKFQQKSRGDVHLHFKPVK